MIFNFLILDFVKNNRKLMKDKSKKQSLDIKIKYLGEKYKV